MRRGVRSTVMSSVAVSDRHRWQAFGVGVATAALTILDLNKVNVSLPEIERDLNAGPAQLQFTVVGYALAFGLTLIPAGRIGDVIDRRRIFLVGLSAFGVASLLCGFAATSWMLVGARVLQGFTAGMLMPQVLGMIQTLFTGRERGRAFGLFGAIIGLSTAFGPTLGGLLIALGGDDLGWRLGFWFNVPVAAIALLLAFRLLPPMAPLTRGATIDWIGLLLVGGAVLALMLPFSVSGEPGSDSPLRWLWLLLSAALVWGFVRWERHTTSRGRDPVLDLRLLRIPSYRHGLLIGTAWFSALPAVFLLNTLFLQQGLGFEPVVAGMVSIPFALASAVTAWLGGRLVFQFGRRLVIAGVVTALVGFAAMLGLVTVVPPEIAPWAVAACMLVAGAGGGFVASPNQTLTLSEIPPAQGGVAGSVGQVGQRVGTAIGISVTTSFFYNTLAGFPSASVEAYHAAFRNGFLVAVGAVVLTLVFAIIDRGSMPAVTGAIPTHPIVDPDAA